MAEYDGDNGISIDSWLEESTDKIAKAKAVEDIETESEIWEEILKIYREALNKAENAELSEVVSRMDNLINETEDIIHHLERRRELKDLIETGRANLTDGDEVSDDDTESAMRHYARAGEMYLQAHQLAGQSGFNEAPDLDSKLAEIRSLLQELELTVIAEHIEWGLYHLGENNSVDLAREEYTDAIRAIDGTVIDIPTDVVSFRWRTISEFYEPLLDIVEDQIYSGIEGFDKGAYEPSKILFDEMRALTDEINEKANKKGMDDIASESDTLNKVCQKNIQKIESMISESKTSQDVSLLNPDLGIHD